MGVAGWLMAATALVQAGNQWQQITVSSSGTRWLVRENDRRNEDNLNPVVWVSLDYSGDRTVAQRSAKRRFAIDCAAATYQMLANIEYDANGSVVSSRNYPANRFAHEPIAPETVTEALAQAVCPTGRYGG